MSVITLLIIVLVILLIVAFFGRLTPYGSRYGYAPVGLIGAVVLILVVLLLLHVI